MLTAQVRVRSCAGVVLVTAGTICLGIFDQILKRWNLIVCGPERRSGPDMQRDYGPASPTRIREMRPHPVC